MKPLLLKEKQVSQSMEMSYSTHRIIRTPVFRKSALFETEKLLLIIRNSKLSEFFRMI